MSYASKQDMIDRVGSDELAQITDRVNAAVIDDQVLGVALSDADATINSYIEGRYKLPLASVPQVLVAAAVRLARYQLHDDGASEQISKDRDDTLQWLKDISRGLARLGDDDASIVAPTLSQSALITRPNRPSIEDEWGGF